MPLKTQAAVLDQLEAPLLQERGTYNKHLAKSEPC